MMPIARRLGFGATIQETVTMAKTRTPRPSRTTPTARNSPVAYVASFQKREYTVGRVVGVARLFFRASTKDVAAAAREQFARWTSELGAESWPWWRRYDRGEWQAVDKRTPSAWTKYLDRIAKDSGGVHVVDLGEAEEDPERVPMHASSRQLEIILHCRGSSLYSTEPSMLQAMMPAEEAMDRADEWRVRVCAACDALPVQTGIVGFALAEGSLRAKDKAVDSAMRAVLRDHATIDVEESLAELLVRPDRIRGIGWLTVLGKDVEAAAGGEARLRRELPASVQLHRTRHALVVQAGPKPVLGTGETLAPYRAVHHALQKVLTPLVAGLTAEGKALFARLA